jgi:hypothetical protein
VRIEQERVTLHDPAHDFKESRNADQNEQDSHLGGQFALSGFLFRRRSGTWRWPRLSFDLVAHYFSSNFMVLLRFPDIYGLGSRISLRQGA